MSRRGRPELRVLNAAAQTRVVSMARIRLGSGESARASKGIICDNISEFESSLSGRVGVKRFQTAPSIWCGMFLAGSSLLSGIGTVALPIWDQEDEAEQSAARPSPSVTKRTARATNSPHPSSRGGRSFRRRAEFAFSPIVFLLCTTRGEIHERHKCALTARALLFARVDS